VEAVQIRAIEGTTTSQNVYFWVDDLKFIATGSISDAPNVVGNDLTWGHYVTGHRFECTYCHDASSDHIDGQRPSIIYDYFANTTNPTGFRLYSAPGYGLQLPYIEYIPGPDGAFALCYQCHDEAVLIETGSSEALTTNFTDEDYIPSGPENLHLYHIQLQPNVYHTHCVMCHDPHGQANPAMVRKDAGDWLYYDTNGCEIFFGQDSDSDGTMDWYDPDINQGGAQRSKKSAGSYPMCTAVCHTDAAPPNPDCEGSNPYTGGLGMNGFTNRSYAYVPHDANMEVGPICLTAGCHPVSPLHAAHFEPDPGPDFPLNETGCDYCHMDGREQCQGAPVFADDEFFADTSVCDSCHGPGGP
jgi:predicted CXXCH cytochrome family protein